MASNKYYPEDVLVEKMQSGEYGWLEFINHHSAEWQEEYESYCLKTDSAFVKRVRSSLSITRMRSWRRQ